MIYSSQPMKRVAATLIACMFVPHDASAQQRSASDQTPESAQAFLASAVTQWARVSTSKMEVHAGVKSVGSQAAHCETVIKHNEGTIIANWRQAGAITMRELRTETYPHLLKVERPNGHLQLYFSSAEIRGRALIAAEFLKSYCATGAF